MTMKVRQARPAQADRESTDPIAAGLPLIFPASRGDARRFTLLVDRHGLTGDAVFIVDPAAKVNQLAVFRTEWTMEIIRPLDGLAAVGTLHENNPFVAGCSGLSFRTPPAIAAA